MEATKSSVLPVIRAATFWAPVTRPFPYSILYYTDDAPDGGKLLRNKLAEFEKLYDTGLYTFTNYISGISVPVQIHQGTADEAVPPGWSRDFVRNMGENGRDVTYFEYPGADHNMSGSWDNVVARDIIFFGNHTR